MSLGPATGMFAWYKADVGVTKDGSNRVSNWADQSPNGWDMAPVDAFGNLNPVINWPVFNTGIINGLPALKFTGASFQNLQHNFSAGASNLPTADGSPVMGFALIQPTAADMGVVCTLRLNDDDLEFGARQHGGGQQYYVATAQDAKGLIQNVVTNRTGQNIVMDWEYAGPGSGTAGVNGIPLVLTSTATPISAYVGESGFNIGSIPAVFAGYMNAYLTELILYPGTSLTVRQQTMNYLFNRAGVLSSPRPVAQAATGPSALIGAAATGHHFRYAPKAFGDVYSNAGRPSGGASNS